MIESTAEILEGISGDIGELSEIVTGNHYLELFQSAIRVNLHDAGVTVQIHESVPLPFEITDVLLCAC
jgi:hypothetical protein